MSLDLSRSITSQKDLHKVVVCSRPGLIGGRVAQLVEPVSTCNVKVPCSSPDLAAAFFSPFQLHQGAHPTGKWLIVSEVVKIKEKKKGKEERSGQGLIYGWVVQLVECTASIGKVTGSITSLATAVFPFPVTQHNLNTTRKRRIPLLLSLLFCMLDLILIDIMQNYTWVEGTTFVDIPCTN